MWPIIQNDVSMSAFLLPSLKIAVTGLFTWNVCFVYVKIGGRKIDSRVLANIPSKKRENEHRKIQSVNAKSFPYFLY